MRRIRWGIGGLFLLWVMGIALWAAVALARIARGETTRAAVDVRGAAAPKSGIAVGPEQVGPLLIRGGRAGATVCRIEVFECDLLLLAETDPVAIPDPPESVDPRSAVPPRWVLSLAPPPNPMRGPLVVSLALSSASPASLALIDVAGRRVAEGPLGGLGPGPHRVTLSGRPASGVYWLVLRQEDVTLRRKLVVLP